jgi:16S rRNA processing protein RimM
VVRVRATGPTLATLRPGERVGWVARGGASRQLEVVAVQEVPPHLLIHFGGVETRDQAEALAGGLLRVPRSRLPRDPDPDVVFVRDLIGCAVRLGDRPLGVVREVLTRPANDVLEVERPGAPIVLIPFTRDAVRELDLPGRTIVVRPDLVDPEVLGDAPSGTAGPAGASPADLGRAGAGPGSPGRGHLVPADAARPAGLTPSADANAAPDAPDAPDGAPGSSSSPPGVDPAEDPPAGPGGEGR